MFLWRLDPTCGSGPGAPAGSCARDDFPAANDCVDGLFDAVDSGLYLMVSDLGIAQRQSYIRTAELAVDDG